MEQHQVHATYQPGSGMSRGKIFSIVFFTSLVVSIAVFILMYKYYVPYMMNQQQFSLPNIVGSKLEYSKMILEGKGLNFTLNGEEYDLLIPAGSVLRQEPSAGTMVKKGDVIKLEMSKGKKMAAVPNVLNMSVEQAAIEITKAGLIPDKMDKIQSASVPKGCVISLQPQQGTTVELGSRVNLVVSEGQPKIAARKPKPPAPVIIKEMVPEVVGKYLDEAQKILESKGFRLGKINKSYSDDQDFDIVLSQYPKPGMSVKKGSDVSLTINSEVQSPAPAAPAEIPVEAVPLDGTGQ